MLIAFISALMSLSLLSDSYPCSHASTLCWYFNHCCDASITLIMLLSQLSWLYSSCHDFISAVMIIFLLWSFYPSKEAVSAVLVYSSLLWHFLSFQLCIHQWYDAPVPNVKVSIPVVKLLSIMSSFYPCYQDSFPVVKFPFLQSKFFPCCQVPTPAVILPFLL